MYKRILFKLLLPKILMYGSIFSQNIEWEKFFEIGSSVSHLVEINDSMFVVGRSNLFGSSKAYIFHSSGKILDSLSIGIKGSFENILKSKENELYFVLSEGTIVVTNLELKTQRSYKLSNNYISKVFLTDQELIILGSEYVISKVEYYKYILSKDLKNLSVENISDYNKFQINYYFQNKDYINIFRIKDTFNIIKNDSLNVTLWHYKFNKDTIINSVKELSNGDLILLGYNEILIPVEQTNLLIIRMSNNGEIIWAKNFPPGISNTNNRVYKSGIQITEDQFENLYIIGDRGISFIGPFSEAMVLKLDKSGKLIWEKYKHYCEGDIYEDIIINSRNDIFISGTICYSDVLGVQNGIVLKMNKFGTGISNLQKNDITLFPNPTIDKLNLKFTEENESFIHSNIKIIDLLGNVRESIEIFSNKKEIDVSDLNSGCYTLQLITKEGNLSSQRFIKN